MTVDVSARATRGATELRSFTVDDLEMRDSADGNVRFTGVASVVDVAYTVRDRFGEFAETIAPGAFNRTIKQRSDTRLLKNHNPDFVFARTKSGTMTLTADPHLRVDAPSLDPANPQVQTLRSELGRGDVDQMSIGMIVRDDVWNDDYTERTVREIELPETSIVTFAASPTTQAAIRSLDELMATIDDADMDEADLRRAIEHFTALLPDPPAEPTEEGSGLYVSDALLELFAKKI